MSTRCLDITNPDFQMSFPRLAASYKRPIQGHRNRRGGCCGSWRSSSFKCGSRFQHATPECLGILAGIDGEHLHQQVGGGANVAASV